MVPFHTLRVVRSLKLRQVCRFFEETHEPENDNPSTLVLQGLHGGVVLGDGIDVCGDGECKDSRTAQG
jgi:hypothetical protein